MQQVGIMKKPVDIDRKKWTKTIKNVGCRTVTEYNEYIAKRDGYNSYYDKQKDKWTGGDYYRQRLWNKGICEPMEINERCTSHIGCIIGEDRTGKHILDIIFGDIEKMPYGYHGYDFICKRPREEFLSRYRQFKLENKEYKIDVKISHLRYEFWNYIIYHNNSADYFLLIGLGDKDNTPQYILFIHGCEMIRGNKFWDRPSITIGKYYPSEFSKYEIRIN